MPSILILGHMKYHIVLRLCLTPPSHSPCNKFYANYLSVRSLIRALMLLAIDGRCSQLIRD